MAVTVQADNSTTPGTLGVEEDLHSNTTPGIYQFMVDLNNLAAGEVVEFRIYTICRSGGTSRLAFRATYGPVPPETKIVVSPAIAGYYQWRVSIEQTGGTLRSFPWAVLKL